MVSRRRGPSDSGSGRECKPNLDLPHQGDYIGSSMGGRSTRTGEAKETRADRLARALRDNLRRRKSQARARAEAEIEPGSPQTNTDAGDGAGENGD